MTHWYWPQFVVTPETYPTYNNPKFETMGSFRHPRWWYLKRLKNSPTWANVTTTLEKDPNQNMHDTWKIAKIGWQKNQCWNVMHARILHPVDVTRIYIQTDKATERLSADSRFVISGRKCCVSILWFIKERENLKCLSTLHYEIRFAEYIYWRLWGKTLLTLDAFKNAIWKKVLIVGVSKWRV